VDQGNGEINIMIDFIRENLSYYPMYYRMLFKTKKEIVPERVDYGSDKDQYFYYYEPKTPVSDKIIVWVHGGGWNAGNPQFFDFVGQNIAREGYRFVSLGYRLSPKNKYPVQIEDTCAAFNAAVNHLKGKGIDTSRIILSGPSAGAHLSSILCYSRKVNLQPHRRLATNRVVSTIVEHNVYIVLRSLVGHNSHTAHVHNSSTITIKAPDFTIRLCKSNTQSNLRCVPH
jgi:hypothetical protein